MKLKFVAANSRAFSNFPVYTHLEIPPYRISLNSQRFKLPLFIASHVALTVPVLRLCCQMQAHRVNKTLGSLFGCGLLHALQPSVLYGWEATQPVVTAFFVSSAAKLLVCYGLVNFCNPEKMS